MNWVLIVVLCIFAGYGIKGRRDGFFKTIFSTFTVIIALGLSMTFYAPISKALQDNDKLNDYVCKKVAEVIEVEQTKGSTAEQTKGSTAEQTKGSTAEQEQVINQLDLPRFIKNSLLDNNNVKMYKELAVNQFRNYVYNFLAAVIINAGSFIVLFVLVKTALIIIGQAINIFTIIPVIRGVNRTMGLFIGLFRGLLAIWILCIILTAFSGTRWGMTVYQYINESFLLSYIYNNNLLLRLVANVFKEVF